MKQLGLAAGLLALAALVGGNVGAREKKLTIKQIMTKAHKGSDAYLSVVEGELKDGKPDWDKVAETAKNFEEVGKSLPELEPSKGDKDSWKKLSEAWVKDLDALEKAAEKKDTAAATKVAKKLRGSCKGCHTPHR